jgi:hypothetical protein
MATYKDQIRTLLASHPGLTERQLVEAIFGRNPFHLRIHNQMAALKAQGVLRKEGRGGKRDPYRYYLTDATRSTLPHESTSRPVDC